MKYLYIGVVCSLLMFSCSGHDEHDEHDEHEEHNEALDEAHAGHSDEIVFHDEKADAVGLVVEELKAMPFRSIIKCSGEIGLTQSKQSRIIAPTAGVVSFHSTLLEGKKVGGPLFTISSSNLQDGDPVLKAQVAYEIAKQEYDRMASLMAADSKMFSQKEYNAAKQTYEMARINYEALAKQHSAHGVLVSSPLGYLADLQVKEGQYVEKGELLAVVADNQRLLLNAEVSEKYFGELDSITSAAFKTSYGNRVYQLSELNGKLLSYGKDASSKSHYLPVTFEFDNPEKLVSGSYVEIYLYTSSLENVLSLPYTAIVEEQGAYFAYVREHEEAYKKQEVFLGMDDGDKVQILSGLKEGDWVVTKAAYQLKLSTVGSAIPAHSHSHSH